MNITEVNYEDDSSTFFILKNSLNNILIGLDDSSTIIIDEIENKRTANNKVFIILLIFGSLLLLLALVLIIPLINKVKKNKQDVLDLFMHIKKHSANTELSRCRKFLGSFQTIQETEYIVEDQAQDDQDDQDEDATVGRLKKMQKDNRYGTSKRKSKRLILNLGIVVFQFIFIILIMEGFFVLNYFLSYSFLNEISSVTEELGLLIKRFPDDSLLLLADKYRSEERRVGKECKSGCSLLLAPAHV